MISAEKILNYIHSCMDAFLFYSVKRQDLLGKKLLSVHEKYYLADHGIRQAVLGSNTQDIALVLENIVFLELIRRDYEVTVGNFYFEKYYSQARGMIYRKNESHFMDLWRTVYVKFIFLQSSRDYIPAFSIDFIF